MLTSSLAALTLNALCSSVRAAEPPGALPPPATATPTDSWDLSAIYPTVDAWQADLAAQQGAIDALVHCKGQLRTELQPCLDERSRIVRAAMRIHTYASNASAADNGDATWMSRAQQADNLAAELNEAASFFEPEILQLGAARVEKAITKNPALAPFDHDLESTLRRSEHTLDSEGESLLAASAPARDAPDRLHGILVDAEIPWPSVTMPDGRTVVMNDSAWTEARASSNAQERQLAFDAFFAGLHQFQGTLGGLLDTAIAGHWMEAKARSYPTSVAAALDVDHIPATVYTTLVAQTNKNLPTLHRYLRLRQKMLGLAELTYSDMYPPLVSLDRHWTLQEAEALVLEATAPLGAAYTSELSKGFTGRWMDVSPRPGKSSGAYMDGAAYDVHPFLLLNFTGDYESVSTLAHEWGHAMHSVLSNQNQPYPKADYSTFIAEIASTANEALLLETMLKHANTDDERLYYLGQALENLRTTYFRQAQFGEFELAIHAQVEKGEPLTGEGLSTLYRGILDRYYGASEGITKLTDRDNVEWAFIPHFYYDFYLYQYATSIAASSLLMDDVLAGKPGAVDRYLTLLKSGCSEDPTVLLERAGVDLTSPAPYDAIAGRMNRIMDEMEAILAKRAAATPVSAAPAR